MDGMNLKFGFRDNFLEGVRAVEELAPYASIEGTRAIIDAATLRHKEINDLTRYAVEKGAGEIILKNVYGQRYIGTRLFNPGGERRVKIAVYSYPGNDLGAFLDGHRVEVYGNAQDGVGNTMDSGEIVVHGRAADVVAMSMRGGKIFIKENVGYRAAIHMKEYEDKIPVLVIGGTAQDFFGEYMAGGKVILLGLNLEAGQIHRAHYIGTGMHGGVIYLRGSVEEYQLGQEVGVRPLDEQDKRLVEQYVKEYCSHFGYDPAEILDSEFIKLLPVSKRPYGKIYAY